MTFAFWLRTLNAAFSLFSSLSFPHASSAAAQRINVGRVFRQQGVPQEQVVDQWVSTIPAALKLVRRECFDAARLRSCCRCVLVCHRGVIVVRARTRS